jgi:hypothetical protein
MIFVLAKLSEVDANACVKASGLYSLRFLAGFLVGYLVLGRFISGYLVKKLVLALKPSQLNQNENPIPHSRRNLYRKRRKD